MSHEINPYLPTTQTFEMHSFVPVGNIIDNSWYHIIKKENGRVDALAILILAEIVYWYRPSYPKDELGGGVKMLKKFKKDILQKDYEDLQNQFGVTKEQARDALITLEKLGICEREVRVEIIGGRKIPNILFIRLNHLKLKELTENFYRERMVKGGGVEADHPRGISFHPHGRKLPSNTKNTPKTTPKKQQQEDSKEEQKEQKEKPSAGVVFFEILKDLDIKDSQKEWLTQNYDEATVTQAVTYALNPAVKIREGLIQTIKWACKEKPEAPVSKEDREKYNHDLAHKLKNKTVTANANTEFNVWEKYIEICFSVNSPAFVLEYSDSGFKEKLKEAFKKYGIKPK